MIFGKSHILILSAALCQLFYAANILCQDATEISKLKKIIALQQSTIKKILNSDQTLNGDKSFTGKVGVGTSSPKTNLHIHKGTSGAAIGNYGLLVENNDHAFIELASPATKKGILMFSPAGNETNGRISYNGSGVTPPNAMQFATGDGNPKMTIDNEGNIGIGTSTPTFSSGGGLQIEHATRPNLKLQQASTSTAEIFLEHALYINNISGNSIVFRTPGTTERMRINGHGKVGIGTSNPNSALHVHSPETTYLTISGDESRLRFTSKDIVRWQFYAHSPSKRMVLWDQEANHEAAYVASGTKGWTHGSDARLKENITDIEPWLNKIMEIQVRRFNWKRNKKEDLGFIAQELKPIFPEAVVGNEEDFYVDDEGNPQAAMGITQTALIPILVKAIQELNTKHEKEITTQQAMNKTIKLENDNLKTKVQDLENSNLHLMNTNQQLVSYLCTKDPDAPFCQN